MVGVEALGRLAFAFTLGGFTFFAPCAFPLLPGYLAYYLGTADGDPTRRTRLRRGALVGVLVSAGFLLVYAALGGLVAVADPRALRNVSVLELVVGALLVALGSAMAAGRSPRVGVVLPERRRSGVGFFSFGVVYAAAAAGCTAPLFVSAVAAGITAAPLLGAATLVAYAAGMSAVMVAVTALAALGRGALLSRLSASTGRIERVAGALLVVAGIVQMYLFLFRYGGLAMLGLR